jgi:hypothetical protein
VPPATENTCTCGQGRTCRTHARSHAAAATEAAWSHDAARLRALRRARRSDRAAALPT